MTNNDILRRIRYIFDLNDAKMMSIFALAGLKVTREQVSDWLKKDDDPSYRSCSDIEMANFLNGFITEKRGKKEGATPEPEKKLTNNIILRKLKIALNMQNEDVLSVMKRAGLRLGKHELSAFFRRVDHKHHRACKDQVMRNFLQGLQMKYRPVEAGSAERNDAKALSVDSHKENQVEKAGGKAAVLEPAGQGRSRSPRQRVKKTRPSNTGFDWNNLKK